MPRVAIRLDLMLGGGGVILLGLVGVDVTV